MPFSPSSPTATDQAAEWVARRSNGQQGAEDQRAFLVWLNSSEENRLAYAKAEALWERLRGLDEVAGRQLGEARALGTRKRRPTAARRLAVAAVLLLAAGLAWHLDPLSQLGDRTYRTAQGEIKAFDLADGSRLELDTRSEAEVHFSRRHREVRLMRGRALFTVAHGDQRPFDVFVGAGQIRDIGTQFDVSHVADGITVAVLDGQVEVTSSTVAAPVPLQRGQRLSYSARGEIGPVQAVDIDTYSSWREGKLVFQSKPLREVLAELSRYQPASLTVATPRILDTPVSGVFPIDNLPQAMQTIAAALPIRLTRTGESAWRIDAR